MKARYIQPGKTIDFIPSAAVAAGDVVAFGELVGVAARSIAANELGALDLAGVFDVVKDDKAITAGAKVYWTGTAASASEDNGEAGDSKVSYSLMGHAVAAAEADAGTVRVRLG